MVIEVRSEQRNDIQTLLTHIMQVQRLLKCRQVDYSTAFAAFRHDVSKFESTEKGLLAVVSDLSNGQSESELFSSPTNDLRVDFVQQRREFRRAFTPSIIKDAGHVSLNELGVKELELANCLFDWVNSVLRDLYNRGFIGTLSKGAKHFSVSWLMPFESDKVIDDLDDFEASVEPFELQKQCSHYFVEPVSKSENLKLTTSNQSYDSLGLLNIDTEWIAGRVFNSTSGNELNRRFEFFRMGSFVFASKPQKTLPRSKYRQSSIGIDKNLDELRGSLGAFVALGVFSLGALWLLIFIAKSMLGI